MAEGQQRTRFAFKNILGIRPPGGLALSTAIRSCLPAVGSCGPRLFHFLLRLCAMLHLPCIPSRNPELPHIAGGSCTEEAVAGAEAHRIGCTSTPLTILRLIAPLTVAAVSGCASLTAITDLIHGNANINGADHPIASSETHERVDLITELVPEAYQSTSIPTIPADFKTTCLDNPTRKVRTRYSQLDDDSNTKLRQCLAQAFDIFHKQHKDSDLIAARNRIQERLFTASELTCARFEQRLNSYQAYANFGSGSLTTILAGAGAIFTDATTARALAGSAAIVSGVRAEYNADFFYKQTISVLTKAIDNWRTETLKQIRLARRAYNSYDEYPIQAAIGDALAYNDGCSLVHGLSLASDAVTLQENPGLAELRKLAEAADSTLQIRVTPSGVPATDSTKPTPSRAEPNDSKK